MMRLITYIFLSLFLAVSSVNAQTAATAPTQEESYKATMDGWLVSLNEAMALSAKTGKPIMANFTGSDWCGWCIRLKNEVFLTPEFKSWAKENVILLELDFPRRFKLPEEFAQQNQSLAQAFQVRGYPTIWVFYMNYDQATNNNMITPLAQTGYVAGGANAFINDVTAKVAQAQAQQGQTK